MQGHRSSHDFVREDDGREVHLHPCLSQPSRDRVAEVVHPEVHEPCGRERLPPRPVIPLAGGNVADHGIGGGRLEALLPLLEPGEQLRVDGKVMLLPSLHVARGVPNPPSLQVHLTPRHPLDVGATETRLEAHEHERLEPVLFASLEERPSLLGSQSLSASRRALRRFHLLRWVRGDVLVVHRPPKELPQRGQVVLDGFGRLLVLVERRDHLFGSRPDPLR